MKKRTQLPPGAPPTGTRYQWVFPAVVTLALGSGLVALVRMNSKDGQEKQSKTDPPVARVQEPLSVAANQSADVPDGFRGGVAPGLRDRPQLEVSVHWTAPAKSQMHMPAPEPVVSWYTALKPVVPQRTYTARDFSGFLPASVTDVGQVWSLDPEKVKTFLRQFHPNPSLHLVATGRRAGPDGAFGFLRAVSPTHLDIAFRVHAEFYITPPDAGDLQPVASWYTPAYFSGRVLVNKKTGTVEHFRLALPTDRALNVFLTANPSLLGIPKLSHDIVRVERMELLGGDGGLADRMSWTAALPAAEADRRLARIFYKFEEVDWVPVDQVAAQARNKNRPIFAIVSWGSIDDQSC